jgi:CheY-like chemotaxis protein
MDDTIGTGLVPADPGRPGYDVLGARLGARTHFIHCALAAAEGPLTPKEVGQRAKEIATRSGYHVRSTTFSGPCTGSHLAALRAAPGAPLAEQVGGGRWRLTAAARDRLAAARGERRPDPAPPAAIAAPAAGPRPLSVLVVDDYQDTADTLAAVLRVVGHTVSIARDGPAALAAIGVSRPDAVLIDVGLPGEDGFTVAKRICAALAERPLLVAMTGFPGLEDRSRAEGFDHHFLKPADPAAVLAALAGYVARLAGGVDRQESARGSGRIPR